MNGNNKKLLAIALTVLIVSFGMIAFTSIAAAGVDLFTITPSTGIADATSAYNATVNTTGFSTLNITIPAGFKAVVPEGEVELAKIDVYNATGTHGTLTITANGSDKIDVTAEAEGSELTAKGIAVNYVAGATTSIAGAISYKGEDYSANVTLTLPEPEKNGSLNISVPAELNITNCSISIVGRFVRNPADVGYYNFIARADGEPVGRVATVVIGKVTNFSITPETGIAGANSTYNATVNTTGFSTLNITIPAGFKAVVPEGEVELAKIDVYNATGTHGTLTITANGSDKIDVTAKAEGSELTAKGIAVNYAAGATTSIAGTRHYKGKDYSANVMLTLPEPEKNGSLNISVPAELNITNCSISIVGQFVRNPAIVGYYNFTARADGEPVGKVATVAIGKVTNFTITPETGIAGANSTYNATVNTITGFSTLNITIPAGFKAVEPAGVEELAKIDVYNATGTHGTLTITANGTDKIDVTAEVEGTTDTLTAKGIAVNYAAGATTSIAGTRHYKGKDYSANVMLTLPEPEKNGSLNISVPAELNITNCSISIVGQFVQNPAIGGNYNFTAKADGEQIGKVATVVLKQDTISPETYGHIPPKGKPGVSRSTNIEVHVKDDGIGVDNSTIVMTVEGAVVTPYITGDPADYTLTYNPPTDFGYSQVVDVTINAADLNTTPNVMEPQDAYSFTTESAPGPGDTTPPTVTSVSPEDGATNVTVTTTLSATFSEAMNKASAQAAFSVDGIEEGTFSWAGNTMTFTPSANLTYNMTYNVTIGTGARDSAGNSMASAYNWSFITTSVPDTEAPTITSVWPEDGATDVSITTTISATFSEAMNETSAEAAFSVDDVAGTFSWAGNTMTFTPSANLAYNTAYTVTIGTGAQDLAGNPMVSDYTWSFTTTSVPDITAPTITSVWPEDGATDVSITTTISATFSEAMNETSAEAAFSVDGVAGTFSWVGNTMAFTPSANLAYNTTYTVTIGTGAQDLAGNSMVSDYTWSFTTTSVPDTIPPTITSVWPADGATDMSITTTISAIFSEAMNKASAEAAFSVDGVAGTFSWVGNTMAFTPSVNLAYNTAYTVTIGTGAQDLAGNSMASDYTWSFTTTSVPDITAPTIISVWPADGATNVPVTTTISAIFSEAMNEASAEAAFSVDGIEEGTFSWVGNTMAFTPSVNLAFNTVYTVTIGTGAQDLAGNPMVSDYTWSFTTESAYDVELTVDKEEKPTVAGLNATYFLTVNNIGNLADSYTLSIDNPDSATVANLNTYTIAILLGTTANVSLNVTNETAGTFRVNVTVVSEHDPANATDFVNTTTTVGPSQTFTINKSTEINAMDIADTNVSINVTGPVNVTIGNYTANPGTTFAGDTRKYIDVRIDNATNVDNMTIKQFYTDAEFGGMNESSLMMYWWDGAAWRICSNTGVNTTDQDGYSGYIWAFIDDSTIPSLSDLTGTPFGSAGSVLLPSVTVISPNGGEDWKVGSLHAIEWTATNGSRLLATNPVTILYSTNNGATYTTIATNEANDGTYTWTIPPGTTSTACLVKVIAKDITGMEGFDVSDAWFTISYAAAAAGGGGPPAPPRDSDGDGISDRDEMLAGTDPNDPCDPNPECAACLAIRPPIPTPTPTAVVTPTPAVTPTLPPAVTPTPVPTPPIPRIRMAIVIVVVVAIVAVAIIVSLAFVPWMRRRKKS